MVTQAAKKKANSARPDGRIALMKYGSRRGETKSNNRLLLNDTCGNHVPVTRRACAAVLRRIVSAALIWRVTPGGNWLGVSTTPR